MTATMEPSLASATRGQPFQFEQYGYFVADRLDHLKGSKQIFNLAAGLKDSWGEANPKMYNLFQFALGHFYKFLKITATSSDV